MKVVGSVLGLLGLLAFGAAVRADEPVRVMTYGPEYLAPPSSDPTITTTTQAIPS